LVCASPYEVPAFEAIQKVFLVPLSLVSAELATGWPPDGPGGVYIWVKEAFGERLGFVAIWLQWFQNIMWYPTVLSFIAGSFAYMFFADYLANNKLYMIVVILVVYWLGTFVNFRGMKTSSKITTICVIGGVFVPAAVLIGFTIYYLAISDPSQITFSMGDLIPDFSSVSNIVFAVSAFLIYAGLEVSAVHANNVKNPGRDYPRAIFISAAIAVVILILGSLSVAIIIPTADINLAAGITEAFMQIIDKLHFAKWILPVMAVFIVLGSLGELSTWIVGPSKGLLTASKNGNLPPYMQHVNKNNVATHILIIQAVIVTIITLTIFTLMPNINSSYWFLSALSVSLYLLMYILLFAAGIKLKYSRPNVKRPYTVPWGKFGMWLFAGVGIMGSILAIIVGLFPPSQFADWPVSIYMLVILGLIVIGAAVPFIIYALRKPGWKPKA